MNLNHATDYAFRAILFLAGQPKEQVVDAHTIAQQQVIPMRFLLKIMPSLIKAGIIKSQRGAGGGYLLAKEPQDITLLEVVEAIEGPLHINMCLGEDAFCTRNGAPHCRVHQALASVQEKLAEELAKHNFGELGE